MVEIRRRAVVCGEAWFDEPLKGGPERADLIVFYHWREPVNPQASQEVHSLEVDLEREPEDIWKDISPNARNLIKRSVKEGLTFQLWSEPSRQILDEFFAFRRRFSLERGMSPADPVWMYCYAAQKHVLLTRCCAPDGEPLVWHSYYRNAEWVRLLHSASLAEGADQDRRRMTGWANRGLHWNDMLECRKLGIRRYDFGGWYTGTTDEKMLHINAFKEQFGGRKTRRYHSMAAASAKGRLYLALQALRNRRGLVHYV